MMLLTNTIILLDKVTKNCTLFALVDDNDGALMMQSLKLTCNVCMCGEIMLFVPTMMILNIHHQSHEHYYVFYNLQTQHVQSCFHLKLHSRFLFALCLNLQCQ